MNNPILNLLSLILSTGILYLPVSSQGAMHSPGPEQGHPAAVSAHAPAASRGLELKPIRIFANTITTAAQQPAEPSTDPLVGNYRPFNLYPEMWTSWSIGALVRALAVDPTHLWIGTTDGVIQYHRRDEKQRVITTQDGLLSNIILKIKPEPEAKSTNPAASKGKPGGLDPSIRGVWFGTYGGGLSHFDGTSWRTYTPYGAGVTATYGPAWNPYRPGEGLGDLWVYDLAFDSDGLMWVATWKGVSKFNGKAFKTYGTEDGLVDGWVYTLSLDSKGSFWFGTEGGVTYYDGKKWKSWTHKDGLGASISQDEEKNQAYPIPAPHHQQDSKQIQTSNPNYILCSLVDSTGRIWFGTWGAGLARFDGKNWKNFTTRDGLSGNVVNSLAIDRNGIIWIGTNGGVSRYDGNAFISYSQATGLLSNTVYSIAVDEENHKWFGTLGGLTRYSGP